MAIRHGDWELLSYDPALGRSTWRTFDASGRPIVETVYEADATIEQNHAQRMMTAGERWGEWRHMASIPANVFFDQIAPAIQQEDDAHIRRWLNDGDNAAFRTFEGRV